MEIFAAQGALPLTLAANQPPVSLIVTGLIDTSGKLAKVAPQLFFKIQNACLGLNPQSQINKFPRYTSPQISFH